mmetsp:Transcript_32774/g.29064  ORF Transcript_32774/g.29064 Transcript_32774/m.29064 type:complete len:479 (+) Transcript_32774:167-1603(+)
MYKYVFVYYKDQDGTNEDLEIRAKLEQIAAKLEKLDPKAFVAELDLNKETFIDENEPSVKDIVGIESTPDFKLYVSMSVKFSYKQDIDVDEVVDWVANKITLSSTQIEKVTDFQKYYEHNLPLVVYVGELAGDNYVAYQEVAKLLMYEKELTFAYFNIHNLNYDLAEALDVKGNVDNYVIKIYNSNGKNADYYEEKLDHMKIKDIITTASFSDLKSQTLNELTKDVFAKILIYHKALLVYVPGTDKQLGEDQEKILTQFLPQIDSLGSSLFMNKIENKDTEENKELLQILKFKKSVEPQLWIVDFTDISKDIQKYKLTATSFDLKSLRAFYTGWKDDKLTVYSNVEDSIGGDEENGVLKLDQSIFFPTIRKEEFETMVFFYFDECDICELFLQVYEQAATELKDNSYLKLAKINMSGNKLKGLEYLSEIEHLPKVMFYSKTQKDKGIEFDEGIKVSDILQFLHKHKTLVEEEIVKEDL